MGFGGSGGSGSGSIGNSTDVALSSLNNAEVLAYNSTIGKWQNQTLPDLSGSYVSVASLATALRAVDACVFYNTGTSSYPLRSTVTSDSLRRVRWIGPTAPTAGGGYAIAGLDVWEVTA
ncbi:MAG: hypothetical protein WBP26_02145 [Candidatus Saccharimonadales bacterium]